LTNEREQSLVAKLMSMKHPTAIAIVLNKDYSYNLPGVSKEVNKVSVSASELPKLGGNLSIVDGIKQNHVQIAQHKDVLKNSENVESLVE
jgi:hypothetical protein